MAEGVEKALISTQKEINFRAEAVFETDENEVKPESTSVKFKSLGEV